MNYCRNPSITDKFVSGLIALINEHFDSIGITGSTAIAETRAYYEQILDQIKRKKILLPRRDLA